MGIASIGDSSSFTVFQVEIKNNRFTKYTYLPGTRYEVLSDPWYKVPMNYSPFGLAQLNQGRVLPAVAVALLQVGTLGWHLQAVSSHQSALEDRTLTQSDREGALAMRNVSAGLFYTAILAGVAEALIVDWLDDSEPVEDSTIFPW